MRDIPVNNTFAVMILKTIGALGQILMTGYPDFQTKPLSVYYQKFLIISPLPSFCKNSDAAGKSLRGLSISIGINRSNNRHVYRL